MTLELSKSSAFNSSGVNVTYWPRSYSYPPDDLVFLDFFAGAGVVRPECDPRCRAYSFRLILVVIRSRPRRRSFRDLLPSDLALQIAAALSRRSSPNLV